MKFKTLVVLSLVSVSCAAMADSEQDKKSEHDYREINQTQFEIAIQARIENRIINSPRLQDEWSKNRQQKMQSLSN